PRGCTALVIGGVTEVVAETADDGQPSSGCAPAPEPAREAAPPAMAPYGPISPRPVNADIQADLEVPTAVRAGTTLTSRVRLTNHGGNLFGIADSVCPLYTQRWQGAMAVTDIL